MPSNFADSSPETLGRSSATPAAASTKLPDASPASQLLAHQEMALIERFSDTYGRLFEQLIAKLNANPADADPQTLRLCVEAISMVLSFQGNFAQLLADLTTANRQAA